MPRRAAERAGHGRHRDEDRPDRPALRGRAAGRRGDQLRAPRPRRAARRRRGGDGRDHPARGVRYPVLVPNERGSRARWPRGAGEIAVFARPPTPSPGATSDARCRPDGDVRAGHRARASHDLPRPGYVSMCFGDPWEGAVDPRAGRRRCAASCWRRAARGSASATRSASPPRGRWARCSPARRGRRTLDLDRCALPRHVRPGAREHARGALAGVTTVDASAGGLGGCPFASRPPATSRPRTSSGCSTASGSRPAIDLEALVASSVWMGERLGRPAVSRVVQALAR